MGKLKLKLPENLGDVLTKDEMKKVVGGIGSGSMSGSGALGGSSSGSGCSISYDCPDKKTTASCSGNYVCVKTEIDGKDAVRCDGISISICP